MTLSRLIISVAWIGVAGVAVIGAVFLISPTFALNNFDHSADRLGYVMGGRYLFIAAILGLALYWRDLRLLTALMLGFAGLAFIDALIYLGAEPGADQVSPVPHFGIGIVCIGAAFVFNRLRRAAP